MNIRIQFSHGTVTALSTRWEGAFRKGDLRLVKRIGALLWLAKGLAVAEISELLGVVEQTVYNWLYAFILERFDSLHYRTSSGRPAKLTKTQKQRLTALITAGPEEAGYPTGCWNSALIQDLGFSYQKARFVSDHLDVAKRKRWVEQEWPQIVAEAKQRAARCCCLPTKPVSHRGVRWRGPGLRLASNR